MVKAVVFAFWGSGEVQDWNEPDDVEDPLLKAKSKSLSLGAPSGPSGLYGSTRTIDGILPSAVSIDDFLYQNNNNFVGNDGGSVK